MNLPGYEEAQALGYTLFMYAANKNSASYSKGPLCLTVRADERATLSTIVGLVEMEIKDFSFPHPRFNQFEEMLVTAWAGACKADQQRRDRLELEQIEQEGFKKGCF